MSEVQFVQRFRFRTARSWSQPIPCNPHYQVRAVFLPAALYADGARWVQMQTRADSNSWYDVWMYGGPRHVNQLQPEGKWYVFNPPCTGLIEIRFTVWTGPQSGPKDPHVMTTGVPAKLLSWKPNTHTS